jgi:hypothetical protein
VIDAATALGKVNVLNTTTLNTAATSLLPKLFNAASFYLMANSLVDNPDTYIKDSNSVIAKPLDIL